MSAQDYMIILILAILFYSFNIYFINVITDQKSKPKHSWSCMFMPSDQEPEDSEQPNKPKKSNKEINDEIETYDFQKTTGLLVLGILGTIGSLYVQNPLIKYALLLSSIFTIFHGVSVGWYVYNDITKLCIIIAGIISIIYAVQQNMTGAPA